MFAHLFRQYTFQILIEILQTWRDDRRKELIEAYWTLIYLSKYVLPKIIAELPIFWPPQPQPDPAWMYGGLVRDTLFIDILNLFLGDPNPQPNSWIQILRNNQLRLTAVRNLLSHFQTAIPQLNAEIQRLEGL
jgi:hypothetical protein